MDYLNYNSDEFWENSKLAFENYDAKGNELLAGVFGTDEIWVAFLAGRQSLAEEILKSEESE